MPSPANPSDVCPLCNGTTWKPSRIDGVERLSRCECWIDDNIRRTLSAAGIPARYQRCDLDSFQTSNDSLIRALSAGKRFTERFPVVDKGLLFYGPPGVGKTHLGVAVLRACVQRSGLRAVFYESRELLRVIRETYNPQVRATESEVIRPVLNAELFVFDDFGAEKTSEWVDETLNLIVNVRYNNNRPTIFTTNFPPVDADAKLPLETLEERVGARIYSRLHEMCEFVPMSTVDYRKLGPDASPEDFARLEKRGRHANEAALPARAKPARAQLRRSSGDADLKWPGGRAGSR